PDDDFCGVRRIPQGIVLAVPLFRFDPGDLLTDHDHRFTEAVDLRLRLTLRRLDHQGAGNREGDGGSVETVIHQPLGDVLHVDAGAAPQLPRVYDALVRHGAVGGPVENGVVGLQHASNVIGVEDRDLTCPLQPLCPHQPDIDPGDGQDAGASPGGCRHRVALLTVNGDHWVPREEFGEVVGGRDGAHSRTATPVRDAKGLVEVQVAHVGAEHARTAAAGYSIHVRPIRLNLPACMVDDLAHLAYGGLENPMCGGIGNHVGRQPISVLLRPRAKIVHVDVALSVGADH